METPESKVSKARISLVLNSPFFASLLLHTEQKPAPIPKLAIDGKHIWYSPEYVMSISQPQLVSDLCACVLSTALLHHCRREWRDPKVWDEASDCIVNPILRDAGFTLSPDALLDPDITADMGCEQAYSIRLKKQKGGKSGGGNKGKGGGGQGQQQAKGGQGQGDGQGQGQPGEGDPDGPGQAPSDSGGSSQVLPPPSMGKGDNGAAKSEEERQWTQAATQAATIAKGCGNVPACLERLIDQNKQPSVDWRAVLRKFMDEVQKSDYAWLPPNKRYVSQGVFLPSVVKKEGIGKIVVGIDTSGSISPEMLAQFCSEVNDIASEMKPEKVIVVYCDAAVNKVEEFGEDEEIVMRPTGGGGTRFSPVFSYVSKEQIDPKCLIFFTDLCCDDFGKEPHYPVMWVVDSKTAIPPWGQTVVMPAFGS